MHKDRTFFLIVLAFLAIYFIWGSTYLFNRIVVREIPPFQLSGYRFIFASAIIFCMVFLSKRKKPITRIQIRNAGIAGILFLTLGNGGVVWALQYVDSGMTALLVSAQPLVLILLLRIHEKKKISYQSWIGVFLGIAGIYLLSNQNALIETKMQVIGLFVIFLCLIAWGYGSMFVSKADMPASSFENSAYQMIIGGFSMILVSFLLGEPRTHWSTLSELTIYSMIFLVLFGSILAFTSFNFLLRHVSPEKVSTNTYVNPIVALFLGWIVLSEIITLQSIMATCILLTGVYFIHKGK